jgi:hypothetical protein
MFDETHCKEFHSVADVIFGASNSTVTVVCVPCDKKNRAKDLDRKLKGRRVILLVCYMLHIHILIANALTDKV